MKDCNGNAIDIGDVVEVVEPDKEIDDTGHATVWEFDKNNEAMLLSVRQYEDGPEWLGWYPTEQLRLVRKKEAP